MTRDALMPKGAPASGLSAVRSSVGVSKGTNWMVYYVDDQFRGRVRDRLSQLGIGLKAPPKLRYRLREGGDVSVTAVYNGKNCTEEELKLLEADLATSGGQVFRLGYVFLLDQRTLDRRDPLTKNYIGHWRVDFTSGRFGSDPTTSYNLRLKLPHSGRQIAEIQLGTLQR